MITIIGGGPAGAYSAYLLSKSGHDVDLFEEHSEIGVPVQCTGIVTSAIKENLHLPTNIIINKIKEIKISSPNNLSVTFKLQNPDLIIDRTKFDQYLIDKAINQDVGIFMNHRLTEINNNKIKFSIKGQEKITHHHKYVIGADGPLSIIGKHINSPIKNYYIGSQALVKGNFNPEVVETVLLEKGFGWIVPENEETARIGILSYKDSGKKLSNLLKERFPETKILAKQGGLIPIYNPKLKTKLRTKEENFFYLIGDAAGMVKATTGGGIVQSIIAAKELEKSIRTKQKYEYLWKQKLGKELLTHLIIKKAMDTFSTKDLDNLIKLSAQDKVQKILSSHSRDHFSSAIGKILMKEPKFLFFSKNFYKLFRQ